MNIGCSLGENMPQDLSNKVNSFLLLTDIMGIEQLFLCIQIQIHGKTVQLARQCQLTTL